MPAAQGGSRIPAEGAASDPVAAAVRPAAVEPRATVPAATPIIVGEPPPPKTERAPLLELAFVGDVVLGEYFLGQHRSFAGPDAPAPAFAGVADLLEADLVVGNLESPVMEAVPERSPHTEGHRFGGSASTVDGLAAGGFNVMSVANNHATDLLGDGLLETPALLRARGITPVGSAVSEGSPFRMQTVEQQGWRVGFVAATTWLNHRVGEGDPKLPLVRVNQLARVLTPIVQEAQAGHDLVIVLLHWGQEMRERPNVIQIHAAHALIDAGADLVIGHHPHVLQGVERYHGGLIAYSLGNFLFPAWNEAYRDSAVLRVQFSEAGPCRQAATLTPVRLDRSPGYAPRAPDVRHQGVLTKQLRSLGRGLQTRWETDGDSLRLQRASKAHAGECPPPARHAKSGAALEPKTAPPESVTGLR